jgi:hypothetical protein
MSIQAPWKDLLVEPLTRDHIVQLYREERSLVDAVSLFAGLGIGKGDGVVLVATPDHLRAFEHRLRQSGCDVEDVEQWGQLMVLDASELLSRFMAASGPDPARFRSTIAGVVDRARAASRRGNVRVYGEMVNLLWKKDLATAMCLELLWNEAIQTHSISLFCAYGLDGEAPADREFPVALRAAHSHLIPIEAWV